MLVFKPNILISNNHGCSLFRINIYLYIFIFYYMYNLKIFYNNLILIKNFLIDLYMQICNTEIKQNYDKWFFAEIN